MTCRTPRAKRRMAPVKRAARWVVESLEARTLLSVVWTGQGDGVNWTDPNNWSTHVLPGPNDAVSIDTQGTSTINLIFGNQVVQSITTNTPLNLAGGTLTVAGTLQTAATLTLSGGTLRNADVVGVGNGQLVASGSGTLGAVTLDCPATITAQTSMTVQLGLTVNKVLTLASTAAGGAVLNFTGAGQTLGGTGQVLMGGTAPNNTIEAAFSNTSLDVAPGITIRGAGTIQMAGGTLLNEGTIVADTSGQTLTLNGGAMTNQGTLVASQGGTLNVAFLGPNWSNSQNGRFDVEGGTLLLGGAFTTAGLNLPAFTRNGGTVTITGTLDNSNSTLALTAATGSWNFFGTIAGGQISETGGAQLVPAGGTLDGVTLDNDVTVASHASLYVKDGITLNDAVLTLSPDAGGGATLTFEGTQSVTGSGFIFLGGQSPNSSVSLTGGPSVALTIAAGITLHGQGTIDLGAGTLLNQGTVASDSNSQFLTITNGSMTNAGTVRAAGPLTLNLNYGFANTATGKLDVEGGALNLNGTFTTAGLNLNTFVRNGGTVSIAGALDNTGTTLALNAATGSWVLAGGTITGGHISAAAGAQLVPSSGTLNGVTIDNDLTIPAHATLEVQGGLTLDATLTLAGDNTGGAQLNFQGTQTVSGTGQIALTGVANNTVNIGPANATLTLGSQITLHGQGLVTGPANTTLVNQGTILADIPNGTLQINVPNFSNQGTASPAGGGILSISSSADVIVTAGNVVLPPGSNPASLVVSGGVVTFTGTAPVSLPSLTLSGGSLAGTAPLALAGPATWTGGALADTGGFSVPAGVTLTVSGAASHISTASFNNAGAMNLTEGTLQLNGGGSQSGSFTLGATSVLSLGGTATQTFTAASSVSGSGTFAVQDSASVSFTGSYDVGATTVTGGLFELIPGARVANIGTLTVNGGTFSCGDAGTDAAAAVLSTSTGPVPGTVNVMDAVVMGGGVTLVQPGWTLSVGSGGVTFVGSSSPEIHLVSDPVLSGRLLLGGDVTFAGSDGTAAVRSVGGALVPGQLDLGGTQRSFAVGDGAAATDLAIEANITDGSMRTSGAGRVQLGTAGAFASGLTIAGGVTEIDDPAAAGTSAITFAGGTLAFGSAVASLPNSLTASPADSISLDVGNGSPQVQSLTLGSALNVTGSSGGSLSIAGPVTLQNDLTLNNTVSVTISGAIKGAFGLTKTGTGALTFSGSPGNTYTGTTTVNGGSLVLNKPGGLALAVPGNLTVNGPATVTLAATAQIAPGAAVTLNSAGGAAVLDLAGHQQALESISSALAASTLSLGGGVLSLARGGATCAFAGSITGTGTLVKAGVGTLTLGPGPSLQGAALEILGGIVACSGSATQTVRSLVIDPGARMDLGRATLMINYAGGPSPADTIRSYLANAFAGGGWSGPGLGTTAAGVTLGFTDSADGVVAGLPPNTIIVKPAIVGDANLDGAVKFADLLILAQHYGQTAVAWDRGDANYDGTVNFSDLLLLAQHYDQSAPSTAHPAAEQQLTIRRSPKSARILHL